MSRVSPYDLAEGDRVMFHWSPYSWARDKDGYEGSVEATVVDTTGTARSGHMYEIKLRQEDGMTVRHQVDNGYVIGKTQHPDMPSITDVGRFTRYERATPTAEEQRRRATRGGARYGSAGRKRDGGDFDFR